MISRYLKVTSVLILVSIGFIMQPVVAKPTLSLAQAIELAQVNDPWLQGSRLKESAMLDRSIASGTLADPKVSLSVANLPTDTWNFEQENMTQLKVGVSQVFPRGNALNIKQAQLRSAAQKFPLLRDDRQAKVKTIVSQLWLSVYVAQTTINLINQDKALFEQLVDVAKASYATASGNTRQQNVIRSQLELVQLDDRLIVQQQKLEASLAQLNEWLHPYDSDANYAIDFDSHSHEWSLPSLLPSIQLSAMQLKDIGLVNSGTFSRNELAQKLLKHPSVLALEVEQEVARKGVLLAKQEYKPQWEVNASYGLRDNASAGVDRADLFSVGVTFDVPLFTSNRQDRVLSAAKSESAAIKTEKLLLVKKMLASLGKETSSLKRLFDRQALYQDQLLQQTHDQAESVLTAYTNDDGDFSEVVRARITELNTKISALQIDIDVLKTISKINYFLTKSKHQNSGEPNVN
ncbi:TolC family protein [Paraglaciecola sp.]|uniref:TolC family protein n=1 Tax=Paraglaciecola sp. TaxID=1920173 RepID=UPI0032674017